MVIRSQEQQPPADWVVLWVSPVRNCVSSITIWGRILLNKSPKKS